MARSPLSDARFQTQAAGVGPRVPWRSPADVEHLLRNPAVFTNARAYLAGCVGTARTRPGGRHERTAFHLRVGSGALRRKPPNRGHAAARQAMREFEETAPCPSPPSSRCGAVPSVTKTWPSSPQVVRNPTASAPGPRADATTCAAVRVWVPPAQPPGPDAPASGTAPAPRVPGGRAAAPLWRGAPPSGPLLYPSAAEELVSFGTHVRFSADGQKPPFRVPRGPARLTYGRTCPHPRGGPRASRVPHAREARSRPRGPACRRTLRAQSRGDSLLQQQERLLAC